ncbi:MAG: hypothetical protein HW387_807 [Parachlamydiales bacterium]|nr:hypothetical protein [Parachlamydiales bacterium]
MYVQPVMSLAEAFKLFDDELSIQNQAKAVVATLTNDTASMTDRAQTLFTLDQLYSSPQFQKLDQLAVSFNETDSNKTYLDQVKSLAVTYAQSITLKTFFPGEDSQTLQCGSGDTSLYSVYQAFYGNATDMFHLCRDVHYKSDIKTFCGIDGQTLQNVEEGCDFIIGGRFPSVVHKDDVDTDCSGFIVTAHSDGKSHLFTVRGSISAWDSSDALKGVYEQGTVNPNLTALQNKMNAQIC